MFIKSFGRRFTMRIFDTQKIFQSYQSLYTVWKTRWKFYSVVLNNWRQRIRREQVSVLKQEKNQFLFKRQYPKAFPFFIPPSGSEKHAFALPLVFDWNTGSLSRKVTRALVYLRVFRLIDHKNQFFTLFTTIGPFAISSSIKTLMTRHSWYFYFNLGSQSYLQNAVPNMWMRWADFPEWARNKVINSLATSASNLSIFIYWMRKCFSF